MKKTLASLIGISMITSAVTVFAAAGDMESGTESAPVASQDAATQGQSISDKMAAIFNKLDANHDGMIDKTEAKKDKALSKSFKKIAKNGKLDQQGFTKWQNAQQAKKPAEKKS